MQIGGPNNQMTGQIATKNENRKEQLLVIFIKLKSWRASKIEEKKLARVCMGKVEKHQKRLEKGGVPAHTFT